MIKTAYLTQAINVFLTGFGQIMLQENRLTGLFFLAGILVNSVTQFLAAVSASLIAVLTAYSCCKGSKLLFTRAKKGADFLDANSGVLHRAHHNRKPVAGFL